MQIQGVLETCLYVDDLRAAEAFYGSVLGLPVMGRQEGRHVFFRCGTSMLLLFKPGETCRPDSDVPPYGAHGPGHVAFAVDENDLPQWLARLRAHDVVIEKLLQWPQGGTSVYFRDPAGNSLELAVPRIWDGVRAAAGAAPPHRTEST